MPFSESIPRLSRELNHLHDDISSLQLLRDRLDAVRREHPIVQYSYFSPVERERMVHIDPLQGLRDELDALQ